jgi:hypothetical protein
VSIPTQGEEYAKLMEHLRKAQESAAMLAHLINVQDNVKDAALAKGWLAISELFKMIQHKVTQLAMGKLQ